MKKVIVFGTFDIIHPGHVHMLSEAKKYGDYLIAVVSRDATVCNVKGQEPKFDETTRLDNIQKLNIADRVRLGCLGDKYQVLGEENPDIVALGYDQKVFVDNLADSIKDHVQIVRLTPFRPEIYKSSKLRALMDSVKSEDEP